MNKAFVILLISFTGLSLQAQQVWTLEKCINHALNNNIQVKQQQLQVQNAAYTLKQDKLSMLPSMNGFAMHGYNWGKSIDRYTNSFATERVRTNNFGLSSSLTLFDGFQKVNKMRQSQTELQSANYDNDKFRDDISLNIATAYLQILFYKEATKTAQNQLEATKQQVSRISKLVEAGSSAQGDLYNLKAQQASDNSMLVESQNNLDIAYLTLTQMLDLSDTQGFDIEIPNFDIATIPINTIANAEQIYQYALQNRPEIKSSELKVKSSEYILSQAQGMQLPSISLQGSVGTGYSGANKYLDSINMMVKTQQFNKQLENNINQSLSFNLNIPIFNGYATRSNISKAKINLENTKYNLETTKLSLYKIIQQAYYDAKAAYNRYESLLISIKAANESYRYAEQRFAIGMMNSVEYNNAKTNLQKSESDLLKAKYDYIFKTTVLNFYMGNPLTLNRI